MSVKSQRLFDSVLRSGRSARASAELTSARLLLFGPKVLSELRILVRLAGSATASFHPASFTRHDPDRA